MVGLNIESKLLMKSGYDIPILGFGVSLGMNVKQSIAMLKSVKGLSNVK